MMGGVDFTVGSGTTSLKEFYVYNADFGDDFENEIGKVLYCYPLATSQDRQLKQVGLCEAIIKFSGNFSNNACESLHTQRARYIFYQPEPEYWLILVLSIPSVIKSSAEGIQVTDYQNDEVQDSVFQACLSCFYRQFVLRHGRLKAFYDNNGLSTLKSTLRKFFDKTLTKWEPNHVGIKEIFFGLQFLPLSREMFLRLQCFVNQMVLTWKCVNHVIILQGTKLVWCGVGQQDAQVLYDLLINEAITSQYLEGGEQENYAGIILNGFSHLNLMDIASAEVTSSADNNNNGKCCHILIYKVRQSFVAVIMYEDQTDIVREFCSKVEEYMKKSFHAISKDLSDDANNAPDSFNGSSSQRMTLGGTFGLGSGLPSMPTALTDTSSSQNYKYVYFNSLNSEEKSSLKMPESQLDAYKLLSDLREDVSVSEEHGEIVAKMESDTWIVAKSSSKREYYAVINQKNTNILEIDEKTKKLTEMHLKDIFFQD